MKNITKKTHKWTINSLIWGTAFLLILAAMGGIIIAYNALTYEH